MNGKTLQIVFIGILATLCFILVSTTMLLFHGKVQLDLYKEVITMLGIPTLIGMIVQAYIHADINKDGIPDIKQLTKGDGDVKIEETHTITSSTNDSSKPVTTDDFKS